MFFFKNRKKYNFIVTEKLTGKYKIQIDNNPKFPGTLRYYELLDNAWAARFNEADAALSVAALYFSGIVNNRFYKDADKLLEIIFDNIDEELENLKFSENAFNSCTELINKAAIKLFIENIDPDREISVKPRCIKNRPSLTLFKSEDMINYTEDKSMHFYSRYLTYKQSAYEEYEFIAAYHTTPTDQEFSHKQLAAVSFSYKFNAENIIPNKTSHVCFTPGSQHSSFVTHTFPDGSKITYAD